MEISTDGTFYAECITWLCHPKQAVEVYGMCMVKCPECGRIVKLEWLLQVTETAK